MSGLVVCSGVIFLVPGAAAHFQWIAVLFLASALAAAWPWLRKDAPYTFWVFACGLWLCLGLVFPALGALLQWLFVRLR
jgi:hypothetical protein